MSLPPLSPPPPKVPGGACAAPCSHPRPRRPEGAPAPRPVPPGPCPPPVAYPRAGSAGAPAGPWAVAPSLFPCSALAVGYWPLAVTCRHREKGGGAGTVGVSRCFGPSPLLPALAWSPRSCPLSALAGVGKSSLVHLLCQNQVLGNPSWTVGCSVDVRVGDAPPGLLVALAKSGKEGPWHFLFFLISFRYFPPQKEVCLDVLLCWAYNLLKQIVLSVSQTLVWASFDLMSLSKANEILVIRRASPYRSGHWRVTSHGAASSSQKAQHLNHNSLENT